MSSQIDGVGLYQINKNYEKHRLKINRILSHSRSASLQRQEQDALLHNRHTYQDYNSRFRRHQAQQEVQKKNSQIIRKILTLSKFSRPAYHSQSKILANMNNSRFLTKKESSRLIDLENSRFVSKLTLVKPTISANKMNRSFSEHLRKSRMLSKFQFSSESGGQVPKNSRLIEKRLKLDPIHQKLKIIESRAREPQLKSPRSIVESRAKGPGSPRPLNINTSNLKKTNPESRRRWE